jgi:DNA-binding MarR family transcriptional regulator
LARRRATTEQVRTLVQPVRWRIVETLERRGPLTSTLVGEALDLSTGVTSYHLRALAEADLIEEAPELAKGRERWWRLVEPRAYIPTDAETPDERAFSAAARLYHLERDDETLRRFMLGVQHLSPEWQNAAFTGSWPVELTAEETFELGMRFLELVDELRRRPHREGAREIVVTLRALPWLDNGENRTSEGDK